jgi:hypothetical protein
LARFASSPSTNSPTKYKTNNTFATTFTGPIQRKDRNFDVARNESMAQAAFQGNPRTFTTQMGQGIQAGSKMSAYRAGVQGDTEAAKGYASAQQQMLDKYTEAPSANLQFQERFAGEKGWMRDLLLDRDQTRGQERMSSYKRVVDTNLAEYERQIKEAIAAQQRQTEILGGLF